MQVNEYFAEWLVRERLAEARAFAARMALIDAVRPARRPARVGLGLALIRIGQWILERVPEHAGDPTPLPDCKTSP